MRPAILMGCLALSCSHTRPDELTADEHRAEARVHEEQARRERDQYRPGRDLRSPGRGPFTEPGGDDIYNPTASHLATADREMNRAADHLAAARKLEQFEAAACRDIPAPERSACPLLASAVQYVHETRTGVELALKARVDGADTNRRLNCHLAYAEANGFQSPSCPLFVRGMTITLKPGNMLSLDGETPEVAQQLRDQARRIFAPKEEAAPAVSITP